MRTWAQLACLLTIVFGSAAPARAQLTLFADFPPGSVPETISSIPTSFNSSGGYLVPDPGPTVSNSSAPSNIWYIPQGGGTPTIFTTVADEIRGGLFLPSSFATYGGQYLELGVNTVYALDSSGASTTAAASSSYSFYSGAAIAPTAYGSLGGNVFLTAQQGPTSGGGVLELSSTTGQLSTFVSGLPSISAPFGMVFAPSTFGAVGGQMLVSDSESGTIDAINSSGQVSVFTTVSLNPEGQTGLRQMAFAPEGFGALSGDLIVSVSGSSQGGGTFGAVEAFNSAGVLVASLFVGTEFDAFDPRGLEFINTSSGVQLLVSDSDPGVYIASPSDFVNAVPEPSSFVLLITPLLVGLGYYHLRSRRQLASA
jgi:hypothetical protein